MTPKFRRNVFLPLLHLVCVTALAACQTTTEIRVENASSLDFSELRIAGQSYGSLGAGETSAYRQVELSLRYAVVELTAGGHTVSGQTLNFGGKRLTYRIDIVDLAAGHLAIAVIQD